MNRPRKDPARIAWMQEMMFRVLNPKQRQKLVVQQFGVSYRQARKYIQQAWADFKATNDANREERRDKVRALLETAAADALYRADGDERPRDLKQGILAANSLAKLDGLDEPETLKHEVSGALALAGETDPERAAARLAELRLAQEKKPTDG